MKGMWQRRVFVGTLLVIGVTAVGREWVEHQRISRDSEKRWVYKFSECYTSWKESQNGIMEILNLDISKPRTSNALVIAKRYQEKCLSMTDKGDLEFCRLANDMREKARRLNFYTDDYFTDQDYLSKQGYSEAFNASVTSMGIDAANVNRIKEQHIELDNFGAILHSLIDVQDRSHICLLKKYKNNKEAFPERDANQVLDELEIYLKSHDDQGLRSLLEDSKPTTTMTTI